MSFHRRARGNTVEITEESLDYNLTGRHLRLRFNEAFVLPGISVHEAHGYVLILIPTTASVHRLIFPHPNKLEKHVRISVFAEKASRILGML